MDVFFLSNGEANAEEHWNRLLDLCPDARRIDQVSGLYQAHKACAESSSTDNFFVVDADAWVYDDFDFKFEPDPETLHWGVSESDCVLVWPARNPVNGLVYGYGGIKMFPKTPFMQDRPWNLDLTTTIGTVTIEMPGVGCETRFNATPESAWIGAFREAAKLASLHTLIHKSRSSESQRQQALAAVERYLESKDWPDDHKDNHRRVQRVNIDQRFSTTIHARWEEIERASYRCSQWTRIGWHEHNGNHSIKGAQAGQAYGIANAGNDRAMNMINDWSWLRKNFEKATRG